MRWGDHEGGESHGNDQGKLNHFVLHWSLALLLLLLLLLLLVLLLLWLLLFVVCCFLLLFVCFCLFSCRTINVNKNHFVLH